MKVRVILIALGVLAFGLLFHGFKGVESLRDARELNVFELKRSPYGEIVGAALQDPVHMMSHGGIGHEHVGAGKKCEVCGVDHGGGGDDGDKSLLVKMKKHLRACVSAIHQNNLPLKRSVAVRSYEQQKIKEFVELAYQMDPSNVGNFMIYSMGKESDGGFEDMRKVAQDVIAFCDGRNNDPGDPLAAAAAAEMILVYRDIEARKKKEANVHIAEDFMRLQDALVRFERVFDQALKDGRMKGYSQKKVDEMLKIYNQQLWTLDMYKKKLGKR